MPPDLPTIHMWRICLGNPPKVASISPPKSYLLVCKRTNIVVVVHYPPWKFFSKRNTALHVCVEIAAGHEIFTNSLMTGQYCMYCVLLWVWKSYGMSRYPVKKIAALEHESPEMMHTSPEVVHFQWWWCQGSRYVQSCQQKKAVPF